MVTIWYRFHFIDIVSLCLFFVSEWFCWCWLFCRLEIIEQVNEAPRMYTLAVAEVVRRRSFSSQFQKVGNSKIREWMNDWMNEWMNEYIHTWMHEWVSERTNERTNERMSEWLLAYLTKWLTEWLTGWMDGLMDVALISWDYVVSYENKIQCQHVKVP